MSDNIIRFDKSRRKKHKYNTNLNLKRRKRFPVFPVILVLCVAFSLFFAFREKIKEGSDESPATPTVNPYSRKFATGKAVIYGNNSNPPEKDKKWVMYQSLSDDDKYVYDMFLDLVENRDKDGYTGSVTILDSSLEELGDEHLWDIYFAMCHDHPEYFFLSVGDPWVTYTTYKYAGSTTYYFEIKKTRLAEEKQIKAFDDATKAFMQSIDLTRSDAEIELQIHDKLLQQVSYNYGVYERHLANDNIDDLGYTAYGALVQDSSGYPNLAVCEGYSLAFEHLLHQAGIPCAVVSGIATHDTDEYAYEDQNGHAWNVVNIDGRWFEVDTTWDDYDESRLAKHSDSLIKAYNSDESLRFNVCHHYFNRTTKEMEQLTATDKTILDAPGYQPSNLRSYSSHTRFSDISKSADETEVFLNSLVPVAK